MDESKFEAWESKRRTRVRCRANESMLDLCLMPSVKHGKGNVTVYKAGSVLVT